MGDLLWLASYPKSGNTWMRLLISNYLSDGDAPVDINRLDIGMVAGSREGFDEYVGIPASDLGDAWVDRLRPEVYRSLAKERPERTYLKVHDAWRRTDQGQPLFPAEVTAGVVYVLRNPLDLVMSCAHHWGLELEAAVDRLCDPGHTLAGSGGPADQLPQRTGCWTAHVRSWLDEAQLPVHLVRYEDLLRAPEATFGGVVRFCGLPWDPARLRKAIAFSAFEEVRAQEAGGGFRERSLHALGGFFRKGRAGGWREELPRPLAQRILAAHGKTMERFGYLDGFEGIHRPLPAVLWFTGLSGAGKSTLARAMEARLLGAGCAPVRLDGDQLREGLCRDLGFSARDRDENIRRAGAVARLLFEAGHIVLCSFISPFQAHRDQVRALIPRGRFFEIHVRCSLETCRRRDPKGLYGRCARGELGQFTGVSSPYEVPADPELVLDTEAADPELLIERLWRRLLAEGIVPGDPGAFPADIR